MVEDTIPDSEEDSFRIQNKLLLDKLIKISMHEPTRVIRKLRQGDLIKKQRGVFYRIDELDAHNFLKDYDSTKICSIYQSIYNKLANANTKIEEESSMIRQKDSSLVMKIFSSLKIPFSKAYESNLGDSLEKAILLQLARQSVNECFTLMGKLEVPVDSINQSANYNIYFEEETPYLLDLQNRSRKDQSKPYFAQITGIEGRKIKLSPSFSANELYLYNGSFFLKEAIPDRFYSF